jgi:hypothetical protein
MSRAIHLGRKILVAKPERERPLGELGVDGKIIQCGSERNRVQLCVLGSCGSGYREHGNGP